MTNMLSALGGVFFWFAVTPSVSAQVGSLCESGASAQCIAQLEQRLRALEESNLHFSRELGHYREQQATLRSEVEELRKDLSDRIKTAVSLALSSHFRWTPVPEPIKIGDFPFTVPQGVGVILNVPTQIPQAARALRLTIRVSSGHVSVANEGMRVFEIVGDRDQRERFYMEPSPSDVIVIYYTSHIVLPIDVQRRFLTIARIQGGVISQRISGEVFITGYY